MCKQNARVKIIGRGGFGTVYLANDRIAVKECVAPSEELEIDREAIVAALLERLFAPGFYSGFASQAIVLESGEIGVQSMLQMKCGIPLEKFVLRNWNTYHSILGNLFEDVLSFVMQLHALGLAHNDIKPDNVVVVEDGGRWRARLIDLGAVGSTDFGSNRLRTTAIVASPETYHHRLSSSCERPAARHDMWSLGCLAYWMLNCRHLFELTGRTHEDHVNELKKMDLSQQAVDARLPPPIKAPPAHPTVERAMRALLKVDPNDRPSSLAELGIAVTVGIKPILDPSFEPLAAVCLSSYFFNPRIHMGLAKCVASLSSSLAALLECGPRAALHLAQAILVPEDLLMQGQHRWSGGSLSAEDRAHMSSAIDRLMKPKKCAVAEGSAEVLPEGGAEVLPEGGAEVLPEGGAEVLPESGTFIKGSETGNKARGSKTSCSGGLFGAFLGAYFVHKGKVHPGS